MSSKSSGSIPSRPSELQLEQLSSRVRVELGEPPVESMSPLVISFNWPWTAKSAEDFFPQNKDFAAVAVS